MVKLNESFDAGSVEPRDDFAVLPDGEYLAHITESEMRDTKAGTGKYLQLTWEVLTGGYTGRLIWDRLNLQNPNQTAVDIAERALSSICRACGVMMVADSEELHLKPVLLKVKTRPARDGYDASSEIKAYSAPDPAAAAAAGVAKRPAADDFPADAPF